MIISNKKGSFGYAHYGEGPRSTSLNLSSLGPGMAPKKVPNNSDAVFRIFASLWHPSGCDTRRISIKKSYCFQDKSISRVVRTDSYEEFGFDLNEKFQF